MIRFLNQRIKLSALVIFCLTAFIAAGQQTISAIRILPQGSVVTTTGIITSGPEFGTIRYLQDANAGIALYSNSISDLIAGDAIIITGVISSFEGQLQLSPVISFEITSTGQSLPPFILTDLHDPELPKYESMRVSFPCMGVSACKSKYDNDWATILNQEGISSRMLLGDNHPLLTTPIPETSQIPLTVSGILSRRNDQLQILGQHIIEDTDPHCRVIDAAGIRFSSSYGIGSLVWKIELPQTNSFFIQYGLDDFDTMSFVYPHDGEVTYFFDSTSVTQGLIYKARLRQQFMYTDTSYSLPVYFTPKQAEEPGIEVYFNRNVNPNFSDGSSPAGTGSSVIETEIVEKINNATTTLDVAMYNTTADAVVQALIKAVQRGVTVRYIADDETSNSALVGITSFPILFRKGDGLMHNKFIIGDAGIPDKAWIWTGSTNLSPNQLFTDPNNAFFIHEQSLAQNYKREFEEMWGLELNHADSRTGDSKNNNTCHEFRFGNTRIESYFSPSDETSCHILDALQTSDHHIEIGLLLLTKEDLVDELVALHSLKSVNIRVILEDEESSSEAIARLHSEGIETVIHDFAPVFHHKYAIIDEGYPESDPMVITGSHNWTFSADNINDENTLIIHNQSFANIYRQEFEARWQELQNTSVSSNSFPDEGIMRPNPASEFVEIVNPKESSCKISVFDVNGKLNDEFELKGNEVSKFSVSDLCEGIWFLQWKWDMAGMVSKLVIHR